MVLVLAMIFVCLFIYLFVYNTVHVSGHLERRPVAICSTVHTRDVIMHYGKIPTELCSAVQYRTAPRSWNLRRDMITGYSRVRRSEGSNISGRNIGEYEAGRRLR